jgi:hypothetical protein
VQSGEILILMAGCAFFGGDSQSSDAAADGHGVGVAVIALAGEITGGMTIHAARMPQDGDESGKQRIVAGLAFLRAGSYSKYQHSHDESDRAKKHQLRTSTHLAST